MRSLLTEIIECAVKRGAGFADIRAGQATSTSITAEDGRVRDLSVGESCGAGLRVLVDGAWGFAMAGSHEAKELRRCLDDALAMARAASANVAEPARVAEAEPIEAVSRLPFRIDPTTVALSERVRKVAAFEERARKHHASIVNTRVHYYDGSSTVELVNSYGSYVRWENLGCGMYVVVTAADEQTRQIAYDGRALPAGWEVVADLDVDQMAGDTAQRAVDLLAAREAPAGSMMVVLDPEITGLITHEAFGHNCEADLVWAGESILAGKEGQQVAAEGVTVVDDPTLPGHNGSFEYDDEGLLAKRHVLLRNGVLQEYLHCLETAAYFGTADNGAARTASYTDLPIPRMSNTFIEAGDSDLDSLLGEVKKGVLLCRARGGYVDSTRGHFSFEVETGYEVADGKVGGQIRNCTLTGYTLETLARVLGLSREFELLDRGTCGKKGQGVRTALGGPYVLVEYLTLGGSRLGEEA